MAQFKTITEAVLRNSTGGELGRAQIPSPLGDVKCDECCVPWDIVTWLRDAQAGDTITIEERETEVE